jgi:purine-nucleoside phosphorylase
VSYYNQVREAADALRRHVGDVPAIAVVLGSGLGDVANALVAPVIVPYRDLPHWPASTVPGHEGFLAAGGFATGRVTMLAGRCHAYEGHDLRAVTFAVRVLGLSGTRVLVVTNAAGGINTAFAVGSVMVIDDHINLMGANPLTGPNDDRFGPRFPDMSAVYSPRLGAAIDRVAAAARVSVVHGVYAAVPGPSYETPAEIRYLRTIGADAVGMSTVPEAIVARHMGMELLGLSCITNMAAGVLQQRLTHDDVIETARRMRTDIETLLEGLVALQA